VRRGSGTVATAGGACDAPQRSDGPRPASAQRPSPPSSQSARLRGAAGRQAACAGSSALGPRLVRGAPRRRSAHPACCRRPRPPPSRPPRSRCRSPPRSCCRRCRPQSAERQTCPHPTSQSAARSRRRTCCPPAS
jgi:hypothetical protein